MAAIPKNPFTSKVLGQRIVGSAVPQVMLPGVSLIGASPTNRTQVEAPRINQSFAATQSGGRGTTGPQARQAFREQEEEEQSARESAAQPPAPLPPIAPPPIPPTGGPTAPPPTGGPGAAPPLTDAQTRAQELFRLQEQLEQQRLDNERRSRESEERLRKELDAQRGRFESSESLRREQEADLRRQLEEATGEKEAAPEPPTTGFGGAPALPGQGRGVVVPDFVSLMARFRDSLSSTVAADRLRALGLKAAAGEANDPNAWIIDGVDLRNFLPTDPALTPEILNALSGMMGAQAGIQQGWETLRQSQQQADQDFAYKNAQLSVDAQKFNIEAQLKQLDQQIQIYIQEGNWGEAAKAREQQRELAMAQNSLYDKQLSLDFEKFILANPMAAYARSRMTGGGAGQAIGASPAGGLQPSAPFSFTERETSALTGGFASLSGPEFAKLRPSAQATAETEAGFQGVSQEDFTRHLMETTPSGVRSRPTRGAVRRSP